VNCVVTRSCSVCAICSVLPFVESQKLNYIVAFGRDEVQDVTLRYTRDWECVRQRRQEHDRYAVPEAWLDAVVRAMSEF